MTVKELSEKRQELWAKAKALNDGADKDKGMTPEQTQEFDRLTAEVDELRTKITEQEAAEKKAKEDAEKRSQWVRDQEADLAKSRGRISDPDPAPTQENRGKPGDDGAEQLAKEHRNLFNKFLRCDMPRSEYASACEKRNLQADIPQAGGYIVAPQQMAQELIKAVDDLVFIRQKATKFPLQMAASLGVPTLEANPADADWTSELLTGNEDTAMVFGKRALTPHPLAKRIKVSRKLLQIAMMDPAALVNDRLAYKFAISEEKAFLTGSGTNQPLGVFTASDDGIPTAQDMSTDNTGTAITADGLINAKYALKAQYQNSPSTAWIFSRTAVRNIRKLKDGNGQYLWQAGLGGTPDTILEIPYSMSEYAPSTFTTGLYVGIIGDWRFYWIADALSLGIQRLEELYAATNQVGFIGRKETDGMPVLAEAFVRVKLG